MRYSIAICGLAAAMSLASTAAAGPNGSPAASTPRAASAGTVVPRTTVIRELRLTSAQEREIRGIIAGDRRDGLPTLTTRHRVLRVLTPEQRARLQQYVPAR